MAERKRPLGFPTPASMMQQEFDEIRALLDATKTDWAKTREIAKSHQVKTEQDIEAAVKIPGNVPLVSYLADILTFWITTSLIAKLGIELTETHKRLADCEKAIKELKAGLKHPS
jgi:hypothetical protein